MNEIYKSLSEYSKIKRKSNRNSGLKHLERELIPFEIKNNGVHLVVEGNKGFIDYWPGTGRWISRSGIKGFGVRNLINAIKIEFRI